MTAGLTEPPFKYFYDHGEHWLVGGREWQIALIAGKKAAATMTITKESELK